MIANQVDVSVNESESRNNIPTPVKELSVENREEEKEEKVDQQLKDKELNESAPEINASKVDFEKKLMIDKKSAEYEMHSDDEQVV